MYKGEDVILGIHVDDIVVIGERKSINKFKKELANQVKCRDLGEVKNSITICKEEWERFGN